MSYKVAKGMNELLCYARNVLHVGWDGDNMNVHKSQHLRGLLLKVEHLHTLLYIYHHLKIQTEWHQHHGGMSPSFFLSLSICNELDIHNWTKVPLQGTPEHPREPSICASKRGWVGTRRRLQSQDSCSSGGSSDLSSRGGGKWKW